MRYWKIIFTTLGLIPFGFTLSFLTFYLHAGLVLGYLPEYNSPDPKELSIYASYSPFVDMSLVIGFVSFVVWVATTMLYVVVARKCISWRLVLLSAVGYLTSYLLAISGIFGWYID